MKPDDRSRAAAMLIRREIMLRAAVERVIAKRVRTTTLSGRRAYEVTKPHS